VPSRTDEGRKAGHLQFRIMYIMLASGRYYLGLLKLVLASILPAKGPKDKASIDACVST